MRIAPLAPALLALVALPAAAQEIVNPAPSAAQQLAGRHMICEYTMECFEQEECTFTRFGHDLSLPEDFPGRSAILLGTGPADGQALLLGGALVVRGTDGTAAYQLTSTEEGFARLSVHFVQDLTAITYHGQCNLAE